MVAVARQTHIFNNRKTSRKITQLCFHYGNNGHDKLACPSKEDDKSEAGRDDFQCYLKGREVRKHSK